MAIARPARRRLATSALLTWLCAVLPAGAQEETTIVKSRVPLWLGSDEETVWPQSFTNDDSIGHASNLALGDWTWSDLECLSEAGATEPDLCIGWMQIDIISVFHGGLSIREADTRERLTDAAEDVALVIELGTLPGANGERILLAIQRGMRGSSYVFATASKATSIKHLDVHVADCAGKGWLSWVLNGYRVRRAALRSYFRTDYCDVKSRAGLRALARQAAMRPAISRMEYVGRKAR